MNSLAKLTPYARNGTQKIDSTDKSGNLHQAPAMLGCGRITPSLINSEAFQALI